MAFLTSLKWYLIVVLICISLIISNVEYLFLYLLPIRILLWRNVHLGLLPIFWLVVYLFLYWATWTVCIFWRLSFVVSFVIIFSHFWGLFFFFSFFLIMLSFAVQKFLSLIRSHFREGTGTSLQYSCLENPMDREAWRATVSGVMTEWLTLLTYHLFRLP